MRLLWMAFLAAALALVVATSAPEPSSAQSSVTISGAVVNGTDGGTLPPELLVLMLVRGPDGRLVSTSQAFTDETGRFQSSDLPLVAGGTYAFSVEYSGVPYTSALSLEDLSEDVRLTVYETTQDVSVVRVTRQVMVIAEVVEKDREIAAIEFVHLSNDSDRTLLPDLANPARMSFLRFSLPPQAGELEVQSDLPGREIISMGTGFAVISPVVPGDHSVEFSYSFPYSNDVVSYRQAFLQGAEVYQVLVPDRLVQVEVAPLGREATIDIQGTVYQAWEGRDFKPGQGIELKLLHLPEPSVLARLEKSITSGAFWRVAIPSILGAVLVSLLIFSGLRGRAGSRVA